MQGVEQSKKNRLCDLAEFNLIYVFLVPNYKLLKINILEDEKLSVINARWPV